MSKVGGAIPSWYWPTGIPRRIAVPQQPLERLVRRQATAAKERPAVVSADGALSYDDLVRQALSVAGGIQKRGLGATVAIAEPSASEALLLLLGGLFAEKRILLIDAGDTAEKQAADLESAQASAVLVGAGGRFAGDARAGVPVLSRGDLAGDFRESTRPRRALDVALSIPSEHGLVLHSHFSIAAMCTSLATFIPQLRELTYLCTAPLGCWETLTGVFGALLNGLPIAFASLEADGGGKLPGDRQAYTTLLRRQVDGALRRRKKAATLAGLRYIFVSTGAFDLPWRRRAEALFGQAILPVWGLPEVGPIVAPHPTWFPSSSHGLPLVNVSLVPIDPATGKVSLVPWEMLDQAEACVETLSGMVSYANVADDAALRVGKLFRTYQLASVDNVGVVTLHGEPRRRAPHAS